MVNKLTKHYLYVLEAPDPIHQLKKIYKIGVTTNIKKRVKTYQNDYPNARLAYLFSNKIIPNDQYYIYWVQNRLHKDLDKRKCRQFGQWFILDFPYTLDTLKNRVLNDYRLDLDLI